MNVIMSICLGKLAHTISGKKQMAPFIVIVAYQTFSTSIFDCRASIFFYDFILESESFSMKGHILFLEPYSCPGLCYSHTSLQF